VPTPPWTDTSYGSMVRGALWLDQVVGLGGIFTKAEVREAFPDVAQIDRRLRDLRDRGWRIHTQREDPTLRSDEQRYVEMGAPVWEPGQAKAKPKSSITASQRSKVLHDDSFICRSCGIAPGDSFDDGSTAQLDIARRRVVLPNGEEDTQLVAECDRCRVGGRGRVVNVGDVLDQVASLGTLERKILAGWVEADERRLSGLERLWGIYRALPADSRQLVRNAVLELGE